ncbi:MAG: hypothetical protein HZC55_27145 [Verrucomicrobia bacterium]|nr:hypothetical protein [Verrucomicrobiota bacterium]
MKIIIPCLIAAMASLEVSAAQPANVDRDPDREWAAVLALAATSRSSSGSQRTPAQAALARVQSADSARQAADAARSFIEQYPNHLNVRDARKLEALAALQGVSAANSQYEAKAAVLARDFRADPRNSLTDRFEVALLAERVAARSRLGGSPYGNFPAELEVIANRLRVEFGDAAPVFNFYASIARGADMATARRIAENLIRWPAGREAKAEAQSILNRDSLLNKSADWSLTAVDGKTTKPLRTENRVTLIVIWSPSAAGLVLPALSSAKRYLPSDAQVIYLAYGGTAEQVEMQRRSAVVPGVFCRSSDGANAALLQSLHLNQLPFAVVVDRRGTMAGFGPLSAVPALLQAANR